MQGVWVDGKRPNSKKEVKAACADKPDRVRLEATSIFGDEYDGFVSDLPDEFRTITFVGPDPFTNRKFYGNIQRGKTGEIKVT
jgi:hypothetical protein